MIDVLPLPTEITDVELSVRCSNGLHNYLLSIPQEQWPKTKAEMAKLNAAELLRIPNFGTVSLQEFREAFPQENVMAAYAKKELDNLKEEVLDLRQKVKDQRSYLLNVVRKHERILTRLIKQRVADNVKTEIPESLERA